MIAKGHHVFIKVYVEQWKLWDQVVNQTSHYNTVILMYQPLYWYIQYTNKFVDAYIMSWLHWLPLLKNA